MPSCNPFNLSPSLSVPSQRPITGKSSYDTFLFRNGVVSLSPTLRSGCVNFHRVTSYSRKALVISDVLNRAQRGVLRYLERAESKEGDVWYAQDYRLAQHVVTLSDEGVGNPYAVAFLKTYGRPAEKITWWWRDRSALMRLAEACGSNTPLLHADQAETVLGVIPDYDYSADHSGALPPKRLPASVTSPVDSRAIALGQGQQDAGAAGRKKAL